MISGAFAEYVSVPWTQVAPLPDTVSTQAAAAVLLQGLTGTTDLREHVTSANLCI